MGGINGYLNIQACQALKALKNYALYVEAKNKTKAKSSFRELCYWTMRMSEQEMLYFIEIRDNDGYVLMVPSEIKGFKKECAKMK